MTGNRHKPSKQLRDATHTAQEMDYAKLAQAVVHAVIHRRKNLMLKLPYFVVIDESFPRGIIAKKEGIYDFYKSKVAKLADWLHERGHLPADYKNLMLSMRDWGYREARLTRMLTGEIVLDNNFEKCDNVESVVEENKEGD